MKLSILFHRLGPYHHARLLATGRICDLTAIEFSSVDNTYAWKKVHGAKGFKRVTLFTDTDIEDKSRTDIRTTLWSALDAATPEVVAIPGWATQPALLSLLWCRKNSVPALVMSESQEIDAPRIGWKEWIKTKIVKQFSSGLVGGTSHHYYLSRLGFPKELVRTGYDVVDNDYFAEAASKARTQVEKLRNDLRLPNKFFLTACRFVEKKNLFRLLDAYARYHKDQSSRAWHLILIGDGPLRTKLEEKISDLGLSENILLPGFIQYEALPKFYGLASAYVLASTTEPWGLVINEAMASGLPVLVSDRCGCAPDLVRKGNNGFTFDPMDVDGLARLLTEISTTPEKLDSMGQSSTTTIAHWTPETFARNLMTVAEMARTRSQPKTTWLDSMILKGLTHR